MSIISLCGESSPSSREAVGTQGNSYYDPSERTPCGSVRITSQYMSECCCLFKKVVSQELSPSTVISDDVHLASLFVHFSIVPVNEARERLERYLSCGESFLVNRDLPYITEESVLRGLRASFHGYISKTFILLANADEIEKRGVWIRDSLVAILLAREIIARKRLIGTDNKIANALAGPILQGILTPFFSQEASLRTPEKFKGERLERWRMMDTSFRETRIRPILRNRETPWVHKYSACFMQIGDFFVKTVLAHAKGDRLTQEDGDVIGKMNVYQQEVGYFAIIDGHGGRSLTTFLQRRLVDILRDHFEKMGESFNQKEPREVENLLSSLFVRAQSLWKENSAKQMKLNFVREMQSVVNGVFFNFIQDFQERPVISSSLRWIQDELKKELSKIALGMNVNEKKRFFSCALERVIQALHSDSGMACFKENIDIQERTFLEYILLKLKKTIHKECFHKIRDPGAVVSLALILVDKEGPALWTVNVGDSRILALQGESVYQVTQDAKLEGGLFARGVLRRGGTIRSDSRETRVEGPIVSINVARSLGDLSVPGVTARAKVQRFPLDKPTTVILGCDGVFDALSSEAVGVLYKEFSQNPDLHVAEQLVNFAYSAGSSDNLSSLALDIRWR